MDELIVFLMREFGWTLEYTINLVKTLPIRKLYALTKELQYQKAVENYQIASNFAMALANWASSQTKGRRYKVTDFIGQPPMRSGKDESSGLHKAAQEAGIIMPKGG